MNSRATPDLPELLVIVGPTASGKTDLAIQLAEQLNGEIISADSVQVYRQFDIGTGKPSHEQLARVPHHMIGVVEPAEHLDAASFAEQALSTISEIRSRARTPIVCGGTFLWVKSLIYGLAEGPKANPEIRARHRELVERSGRAALYAELLEKDPASAQRLSPNDFVRVSRALEVLELTAIPMSRFHAQHGFAQARFRARLLGVQRTREELDERILARTRAMLEAGWIDEVRRLVELGFSECRAMGSVGYKQVFAALAQTGHPDPDELAISIYRATRVFARRQRTWLRDQKVEWLASVSEFDRSISTVP
ncbi:MAG TPA: tRNA (adenosine(37)-N6)-dimethylallyltransferase MiaA [Polyangiaceae bacterium]|nr:tRNA (adenosine(37)-N6)-dimethylallyltransferase MiaA [Polyangiaceae bacterium]